jgi:membrane associated rhomboid family serine protease
MAGAMAEAAAFNARVKEVSPHAPVTAALVGINVVLFLITVALGGGFFVPNPEVLIKLGSDYTPLTAAGQWWRLLTSTFLHFGILHLGFNMWALWVNGALTERLYGSSRYLLIYLVAGIAGSVTSFLWHPFVNGAGASGAIFGVLGALFAYFLRTDTGVPKSVLTTQRRTAGLFIVVSILNAAQMRGVDNAAHLGGLVAGFILGYLLCRPLDPKRDEQDWTPQWVAALALVMSSALLVGYALTTGRLHPRVMHDPSGRSITLAEFSPPPHTFGGVTLGMTPAQLLRAKGTPVQNGGIHWIYNSVDAAHNGILDVVLTDTSEAGTVWAVIFWGEPAAEPPGISNLVGFNREDLVFRFGEPTGQGSDSQQKYLYFGNGVVVALRGGTVIAYGIYTPPTSRQTPLKP